MMWVVVYVALSKAEAERLRDRFAEEGILATLKSSSASVTGGHVEVLVAEAEAEDAHEILASFRGRG